MKDDWECGDGSEDDLVTADFLREKALTKYNNMLQANRWKRTEESSSKIIYPLRTKIEDLQQQVLSASSFQTTVDKNNRGPKLMIPKWRTINVGASCSRDGKTWWWCPHHSKEGLFNGLYMNHKPEDHAEWAKKKKEMAEKRKARTNSDNNSNRNKLQLIESMKQALVTEGNMTPEQATALWAKISEN